MNTECSIKSLFVLLLCRSCSRKKKMIALRLCYVDLYIVRAEKKHWSDISTLETEPPPWHSYLFQLLVYTSFAYNSWQERLLQLKKLAYHEHQRWIFWVLKTPFNSRFKVVGVFWRMSCLQLVCYTSVFSVVTQRSSPLTAAENRTTFLSRD